nr:unnamed protein product [Callosobruchus analis]
MVLLAVVDTRYQFIMCDFEVNGRISDGECFDHENIEDGTLIPGLSAHDSSMEPLYRRNSGNNSTSAKNVREQFEHYFNNEGTVPWQDNFIH